jgi:hypothetical protein
VTKVPEPNLYGFFTQDVLQGYRDLCDHVFNDKMLNSDHKKAAEKMANIKKKVRLTTNNITTLCIVGLILHSAYRYSV